MVSAKTETNLHKFLLNMKHKRPRNINAVQGGDTACSRTGDGSTYIDYDTYCIFPPACPVIWNRRYDSLCVLSSSMMRCLLCCHFPIPICHISITTNSPS